MTFESWLSLIVVLGTFSVLAASRVPAYLALAGGLGLLMVTGVVTPVMALSGFANDGVVTIAVLFVVAAGLRQTGALSFLLRRMMGQPRNENDAMLRLAAPAVTGSAFLNNTPVVAMLLPAVLDWCRVTRTSPARLLLPLSYFAILGGLCTLIGTSTNLAINGLLIERGETGLSLFSIAPVGVVCVVLGVGLLVVLAPRFLPTRSSEDAAFGDPRRYSVEMVVAERGPLVGKSVQDAGLRHLPGLFLAEVHRRDRVFAAVEPSEILQADDQLVFVGAVDSVVDLQRVAGLEPATRQVFKLDGARTDRMFAEAVLSTRGPIVGKTIREGRFRNRYGAVVLAVSRNGERVEGRIGDIILRPGDTLFLESGRDFVGRWRNSNDFFLVSALDDSDPPSNARAPLALGILIAMVAASATGILSLLQAAILAAAAMLVTGCCSEHAARRSINGPLLIALAAAFGIGAAIR
ncbi:MAG: SLC13 family permease, partial [Myxococcota bacterium]